MAEENPLRGYRRIHGEPTEPGLAIAPSAVDEILRAAGTGPAPRRSGPTWRQFLRTQAAGILAGGLLHVDTVPLKRLHVLVFTEHGTRRMHLGGVTANPTGERTAGTLRRELPGHMLILGQAHLRAVLAGYQGRCTSARPHQGIAQRVPGARRDAPRAAMTGLDIERIRRKPVLNGLINEYTHAA